MQNNDRKSYIVFLLQRSKTAQKKRVGKIKKLRLRNSLSMVDYINSL